MILVLLTLVLSFFQLTLVPYLFEAMQGVNIVLAFIIAWSMLRAGREAIGLAFLGGLILSLFSNIHFGFLPLFFVLVAFSSSMSMGETFNNNYFFVGLFGLLWCLLFELMVMLSYLFASHPVELGSYITHVMLRNSLINTAIILLFTPLFRRYESMFVRPKEIGIKH